jgi:NTP pyrophosphatase (non-canonical NTP hydrolase)
MLNRENQELCWRVLAKYGCENQMNMVIEECAELQKAVCKIIRDNGHITDEHDENLREELVDVMVVCQQMFLAMRMDTDEINNRAKAKLERALA